MQPLDSRESSDGTWEANPELTTGDKAQIIAGRALLVGALAALLFAQGGSISKKTENAPKVPEVKKLR
jgi:hypothetical protein